MLYQRFGKRAFDLIITVLLIVLLSPLMGLTALAIWLDDRGSPLFRQWRVGRNETPYRILKFRSMPLDTPDIESRYASDLQVTRIGAFIRRTSIDELPQLFNVLGGSMSLVGPRPSLPTQTPVIELRRDHGVASLTPGITGLAQVSGRTAMSDEQKVAYDAQYASSISFFGDLRILFSTIGYLFRKPPVY